MIELDFTRYPVLVVDDERDNLDAFRFAFRKSFALTYATGGHDALDKLETLDAAVVITDQRMPNMSGIELLRQVQQKRPDVVGVLLTAYTDMPVLLESINSGAVYRYVQKPWSSRELTVILRQSIERFERQRDNRRLRDQLARYAGHLESEQRDPLDFADLTAESAPLRRAVTQLEALAPLSAPVLLVGERGTEKELFARALHVSSPREAGPLIHVPCAGADEQALERELFGGEKDAFDGALLARPGKFELAHQGTLVLGELNKPSPALTERLERFLATGAVERFGSAGPVHVDVRLVLTSSESHESWCARGAVHRDLAANTVTVPPLRDRLDDVPGLCRRLLVHHATRYARPARRWSPEAMAKLMTYTWPGNWAELSCVVERAALLCSDPVVDASFLSVETHGPQPDERMRTKASLQLDLPGQLDEMERRELYSALDRCAGNKAEVARMLGIQRTTLYYRLKRLGIEV